jgi:ASC-1-like (ASCH) protein
MLHKMKLFSSGFDRIKSGEKKIEIRLFDEKRKLLKVGDEIEFSNLQGLNEKLIVEILKLERFDTFSDMLDKYPDELGLHRFNSKDEWILNIRKFYSAEKENKYGVLAIHIKVKDR